MADEILWVEDHVYEVKAYIAVLDRRGWKVLTKSVKEALEYLKFAAKPIEFKIVVIDLMMDTIDLDFDKQDFSKSDTMNGLATGVIILKKLRDLNPELSCIYFTNVDKTTEKGRKIHKYAMEGANERNTLWLHKSDVLPRELVGIIKEFVSKKVS